VVAGFLAGDSFFWGVGMDTDVVSITEMNAISGKQRLFDPESILERDRRIKEYVDASDVLDKQIGDFTRKFAKRFPECKYEDNGTLFEVACAVVEDYDLVGITELTNSEFYPEGFGPHCFYEKDELLVRLLYRAITRASNDDDRVVLVDIVLDHLDRLFQMVLEDNVFEDGYGLSLVQYMIWAILPPAVPNSEFMDRFAPAELCPWQAPAGMNGIWLGKQVAILKSSLSSLDEPPEVKLAFARLLAECVGNHWNDCYPWTIWLGCSPADILYVTAHLEATFAAGISRKNHWTRKDFVGNTWDYFHNVTSLLKIPGVMTGWQSDALEGIFAQFVPFATKVAARDSMAARLIDKFGLPDVNKMMAIQSQAALVASGK